MHQDEICLFAVRESLLSGSSFTCAGLSPTPHLILNVSFNSRGSRIKIWGLLQHRRSYSRGANDLTQPCHSFLPVHIPVGMQKAAECWALAEWLQRGWMLITCLCWGPSRDGFTGLAKGQTQPCEHPLKFPLTLPCQNWVWTSGTLIVLCSPQTPRRCWVPHCSSIAGITNISLHPILTPNSCLPQVGIMRTR